MAKEVDALIKLQVRGGAAEQRVDGGRRGAALHAAVGEDIPDA